MVALVVVLVVSVALVVVVVVSVVVLVTVLVVVLVAVLVMALVVNATRVTVGANAQIPPGQSPSNTQPCWPIPHPWHELPP